MDESVGRKHVVLCGSNNRAKAQELTAILHRQAGVSVVLPRDLGIELEVAETGETFAANARLKAEAFQRAAGVVTVADDSGLEVDALGGAPGIYSARFGGPSASDDDRNRLVLDELASVPGAGRSARFVCAIAVSAPGTAARVFQATVEGVIASEPAGANGFGYDPIFYYPPFGCTLAQVDAERKATVSHRGRALRKAVPYLRRLLDGDILSQKGEGA